MDGSERPSLPCVSAPAEHDDGLGEDRLAVGAGAFDLDEVSHAALDGGGDGEGRAGGAGAEDLCVFHGSEADVTELSVDGIRLGDDAAELGDGLDHDHPGPQRVAGEMAFEELFLAADRVARRPGDSGLQT